MISTWKTSTHEYPQSMFWIKNKKHIKKISAENFQFLQPQKILYISWECFRNASKPLFPLPTEPTHKSLLSSAERF